MARKPFRVEVQGFNKVRRKMKRLGKQGENAFRGAMYAEGLHIIDKAVENAPDVTGRLRNSHWVSLPDMRGSLIIGFAVVYAAAVEFGMRLKNVSPRQRAAAYSSMNRLGWRKSTVGGPNYFRGAIQETQMGRVRRVAKTAKRYFALGIGVIASDKPKTEEAGRAKGEKKGKK
jgi:hypothetical protein